MGNASRFAHLHLHTQYSILDGAIGIEKLVERCSALGMPAVAMTDHGNMFGAVEFHETCVKHGIKPIIGCEVYVAQGSRFEKDASTGGFNGINHMILLAMNATGYGNLIRLVSKGFLEGFYYKPRIDMELLQKHSEGLIATSGCLSGAIPSAINNGNMDRAWELVETYSRLFKDRFYLEFQRHGIPLQEKVNAELLAMHRDLKLPLLATNDCHYLACNDAHSHEALLCVQTGKLLDDPDRFRFDGQGFYVKDADEMLEVFHDVPEAVTNSIEIAERCNFELETGQNYLPDFDVPAGQTTESHLRQMVERGMKSRLNLEPDQPLSGEHEEYRTRIDYELDVINQKGYPGYFLIVWDMIRFARERGIPVGPGRGSAAGSLVAYALSIVDIDPVGYRIPFERFLNPERMSMPDIDIDFCMNRRAEVIRYVEDRYNGEGEDGRKVAGIVTFGTMQAKAAIRDCGRVLGMPFADVDPVAKLIPDTLGIGLDEALEESKELRKKIESSPQLTEMFNLARSLEGQIRNPGRHAAGIVISSKPLLDTAPLYRDPKSKEVVVQFDYRNAEKVGLIKFDLLGLRTLTIIQDTVDRIRTHHDPDFCIETTDLADTLTYDLLCAADTDGVFQVGQSTGMTDVVARAQPRHFRDVIPLVALYRPGPLKSGMVDDFIERRHGRKPVSYLIPALEEVLSETYGVILYQDQVLQIANKVAGYSLGEGDLLRRAMGKKIESEMEAQRVRFVEGSVANGHPQRQAAQLFDLIFQFAGYGFGKAHSAAYALITHQTAYLKAHYPAEFYAACMTCEWKDGDKLDRYMKDAARRDIEMKAPCVNESRAEFSVTDEGRAVRFGLAGIKNVGDGAVEAIVSARSAEGPFQTLFDFCERIDTKSTNKRVIESLIRCGAFDFTKATRASLWEALSGAIERGQRTQRDRLLGQGNLFGDAEAGAVPKLPEVTEWPAAQRLDGEKEMLGFYITGHPLADHGRVLDLFSRFPLDGSPTDPGARKDAWLGGILVGFKTQKTRKGDLMARAQLENMSGTLGAVFFPKTYEKFAPLLRAEARLFLKGNLASESERPELHVDEVIPLEEAWSRCTTRLELRIPGEGATPERLAKLRSLLDLVPGPVPVGVELKLPNGAEAILDLKRHRVSVSDELVTRVESLFGEGVVACLVS
ncbi:MAG: DNA polymerase III subunit alpha [bacterium]|nr:DNA polymerase III subunit alpha [bacterium]